MCACIWIDTWIRTCISALCQLRGPRSKYTPAAISKPGSQTLVSNTICNRRKQRSWEKWLILGLEPEIHKMSLEHLVGPESKEVMQSKQ